MGGLKIFLTIVTCVLFAFYAQKLWSNWSRARYRDKVIRNLETLDEIRRHAKLFDKADVIKVRIVQLYKEDLSLLCTDLYH